MEVCYLLCVAAAAAAAADDDDDDDDDDAGSKVPVSQLLHNTYSAYEFLTVFKLGLEAF